MKLRKMLFISLCLSALTLSACSSVQIPNVRICTAAGHISAGADCSTTISNEHSSMNGDQYIAWLNPSPKKSGALCESAGDWSKLITALEQACTLLKDRCTEETQNYVYSARSRLNSMLEKGRSLSGKLK